MSIIPTPQAIEHEQRHGSTTLLPGLQSLALKSFSSPIPSPVLADQNSDNGSILSARVLSSRASKPDAVLSEPGRKRQSVEAERSSHLEPFDGISIGDPTSESSPSSGGMGIGTTPSLTLRRKEFAYFVAMCVPMFLNGWTDASAGPLLPRLQAHYEIGYIVVSMIFVANCIGAITAALTNMWLTTRFGLGITVALAAAAHCLSYAIQATKPPFPLMAISFAINGFGEGLFEAQTNGLVALLPTNPNAKLSFMHGLYGVGAFASPLIATQFSNMPTNWHRYYLVSLGLGLAALGILLWVTRLKHQDALLHEIGVHPEEDTNRAPLIRQVMELKIVHIMAAFILFYVGMEVTVGGWTVTFMQRTRGAGSGAGYVSSGFFGGVAVGRMGLIWVNRKVGLQRVIYIYSLAAIALELTVWFVPSLYENAVAVAFVGVVIGPFYPIAMRVTSVLVPRRALAGAIGWISCVGRIGSAAFPFAFALMASKYGVQVLQPWVLALLSCLLGIWFLVPSIQQRTD